jgi:hypothetical protein
MKYKLPNKRDGADRRSYAVGVKFNGPQNILACSSSRDVRRQDGEVFMPQNSETGRQGYETSYNNADTIGTLLGAVRLANNSNEFRWNDRTVVIKSGSSAVITRATLGRVTAIVYGEESDNQCVEQTARRPRFYVKAVANFTFIWAAAHAHVMCFGYIDIFISWGYKLCLLPISLRSMKRG